MLLEDKNRFGGGAPTELDRVLRNRKEFIELLLDKSKWPTGFKWSYDCCGTCAMGLLAETLVPMKDYEVYNLAREWITGDSPERERLEKFLGLNKAQSHLLFWNLHTKYRFRQRDSIMPHHVAEFLRELPVHIVQ